jgi:Phospholipase_D-nuclease N-terminal
MNPMCLLPRATMRRSGRLDRSRGSRYTVGSFRQRGFPMYYGHNSLWGILVLVADIWAIVNIFQSGASTERKVLWTVLVILLPVLGFIVWLVAGPRTGRA